MTIEELEQKLLGKDWPNNIRINPGATVVDTKYFLSVQFQMLRQSKEYVKTPAYERLIQFAEAVENLEA